MDDWEEFFEMYGDYAVTLRYYEVTQTTNLEQIYQAFKARLRAELSKHGADRDRGE
ncbi:hypothetical protein [Paraburkholderia sp. SIMBA_054]|uniref:hypothetical protein n=1 Tax=Paraburkholderia sp. SIMBA_054 TaxID=3085795 RepID=UPI00397AB015